MAKPRSPVLGYNHNVRWRGLVFHVQTEDSGITNPHVFTHLFHGGVILTTRKLVYDNDSSEEAVKALMQSQHKAVLRDLRKQMFDDKIDAYLGGTPGLLPRGAVDTGGDPDTPSAVMSVPVPPGEPPPLAEPPPPEPGPPPISLADLAAAPEPAAATPVPFPELPTMPIPSRTTTAPQGTPPPSSVSIPRPGSRSGRMAALTADLEGRAPTIEAERLPPPPPNARGTQPTPAEELVPRSTTEVMIPEDPLTSGKVRRDVSAAFEAIMVAEGEPMPAGGGLVEVPEDDVGQVYSGPPPSAPLPPGVPAVAARPTEYSQHRRRESGRFSPDGEPLTPPPNAPGVPTPMPLPAPSGATRGSQPKVPAPPMISPPPTPAPRPSPSRVATPTATPPPPPPTPGPLPRATTQVYSTPPSRTSTPTATPPPPPRPGQPRTRSPNTSGVVVTRPAVIIGAPSRTVGNTGPNPVLTPPTPPPPPPAAPPPAAPITGQHAAQKGRARKAREDTDSGVFGQDLISEKSLDEVILAYLSEDGTEE